MVKAAEKELAAKEMAKYRALPSFVVAPEKFKAIPAKDIHVFAAHRTRNHLDWARVVADSEIENGFATRYEIPDHEVDKYKLPMPWGLYDTAKAVQAENTTIGPNDVPGPGYNWYRIPDAKVSNGDYLYFFYSWIIQVDVDEVFDLAHPEQKFDVWAQLKFEGPAFPHGRANDKNAISVGNVVVVKK